MKSIYIGVISATVSGILSAVITGLIVSRKEQEKAKRDASAEAFEKIKTIETVYQNELSRQIDLYNNMKKHYEEKLKEGKK